MPVAEPTFDPALEPTAATVGRRPSSSHPWWFGWRMWRWERSDLIIGTALAVLLILVTGIGPAIVPGVPLALATPVLWRVDVTELRLPNALVLPIGALTLASLVALGLADGAVPVAPLASMTATFVFFLILSIGGGMGMGDVKLAVVLAGVLALVRIDAVLAAAIIAFVSGGVAALVVHVRSRQRSIPFGPFLLIGFWAAIVLVA
ncbi:leader peptidase (prepilin peptidase)/N-methyltransferase [Labedella gwakjiensis]|uniref:Prepilin peptidase n=1 Tax=Labedella gwakjiensis TaxID=390269 RepID=A0A2P8H178_9MICO|nr:A24 family peptidase [Labedella gwakjiensis]PSL39976.1 leader peptidase (prepilin peptidase)/N-methyltransferase [Labedella gwakjiensis]RUQ85668.1 prepilin peptidase [Labedella gwakjiensis]